MGLVAEGSTPSRVFFGWNPAARGVSNKSNSIGLRRPEERELTRVQARVTQKDVANQLGINQKTVSRAFGAAGYVSPELRQRILAAARTLGYRRHKAASAMCTGRYNNVILLQSTVSDVCNLSSEMLNGMIDALTAAGLSLTLAKVKHEDLTNEDRFPAVLQEWMADGVLVKYDTNVPDHVQRQIANLGLPAVWVNSKGRTPGVRPDDLQAGRNAVAALLGRGHREIAYFDFHIGHVQYLHYSREDRRRGYRQAMTEAGLKPREFLPNGPMKAVDRVEYCMQCLSQFPSATAAVTYSEAEALALWHAVEARLGFRMPDSFSIMTIATTQGSDNLPFDTMFCSEYDLGKTAADMLLASIDGDTPISRTLPFRLEIRGSCAGPRRS